MNFQKTIEKITGFQLTFEQWEICSKIYLYGDSIYSDEKPDEQLKKLEKLKLIEVTYEKKPSYAMLTK